MSRKEAMTYGYLIAIALGLGILIVIYTCTPSKRVEETQIPETEGVMIDGHAVEVVYDDYGAAYLKYVIGPMRIIYIPLPAEVETNQSDSLKSYYTHGKEINKRRF